MPRRMAALGEHFGADLYAREVDYLVAHEWACTADDVLWRRTKAGLHLAPRARGSREYWQRAAGKHEVHPLSQGRGARRIGVGRSDSALDKPMFVR